MVIIIVIITIITFILIIVVISVSGSKSVRPGAGESEKVPGFGECYLWLSARQSLLCLGEHITGTYLRFFLLVKPMSQPPTK